MMTRTVYEVPLAAGKISPEHEHHAVGIVRYAADHSISELFPADPAVGCSLTAAHSQYRIQQQHTLTGPFLKIRISAHPDAEIRLYLLEYVLQGRRCRHTFRHGKRESVCLSRSVIRILSKDDYLHLIQRRKVESLEYLASGREYPLSLSLLLMQETHQRFKIRFPEFTRQRVLPTAFYTYFHVRRYI